jgi:acid phosphatase type 7
MSHRRQTARIGAALVVVTLAGMTAGSGDGARGADQATLIFKPVADALVTSAAPSRNFGASSKLGVDRHPLIRSYLRFKLSGVSGTVASATLKIYVTRFNGRGITVRAIARRAWTEKKITFRNSPSLKAVATGFAVANTGWNEVDVTKLVKGNGVLELALTNGTPPGVISFASRETRARAPQLSVETVRPDETVVVAAVGNISCDPAVPQYNGGNGTADECRQKATSDLVVNHGYQAILTLGDHQYECAGYDAFVQAYDPTWGRVKSITHPAPGNHDYGSDVAGTGCAANAGPGGYFRYFGTAAGDPTRGYYSFNLGNWHLIALNSNCGAIGGCGAGSAQEQWLRQDLAAHKNLCTLAYFHQPRFTSGIVDMAVSVDAFWRDLVAAGADVVLTAHAHIYERFAQLDADGKVSDTGAREFVVGTGGKTHHPLVEVVPGSEVRNIDTFGVLELTLHPTSYDWRFVPEAGKTFTDSGSSPCH